jgi:hypothetical protein
VAQPDTATEAPAEPGEPAVRAPDLFDDVVGLSQELRELAHDQLQLVTLETKLAARSLMTMIAAAVGIGLLLVAAWLGLMGALVLWLAGVGVAPGLAMIAVVVLNLLAALIPYNLIRRRSRSLGFPATLRSLRAAWSHPGAGKETSE